VQRPKNALRYRYAAFLATALKAVLPALFFARKKEYAKLAIRYRANLLRSA
jgi:hypothetical protein